MLCRYWDVPKRRSRDTRRPCGFGRTTPGPMATWATPCRRWGAMRRPSPTTRTPCGSSQPSPGSTTTGATFCWRWGAMRRPSRSTGRPSGSSRAPPRSTTTWGTYPGRIGTLAGGGPAFPGGPEDQGRTGLAALDTRRDLRGLRSTGKWGLPPRPHLRRRVLPERVADHPVLNYGS